MSVYMVLYGMYVFTEFKNCIYFCFDSHFTHTLYQ